jgi:hypothetical protein
MIEKLFVYDDFAARKDKLYEYVTGMDDKRDKVDRL